MDFDAVILAGGRSSRLGGVPKAQLTVGGVSLLERALQAAAGARRTVVVGPDPGGLPPGVLSCREDPPFSGPAAALAAGLSALAAGPDARPAAPLTLVLACDMPRAAAAVQSLLAALAGPGAIRCDGAVAVSADGRIQPLAAVYDTGVLQRAVADADRRGTLSGGSVFGLLASLELRSVPVPPGSTDDVDTWDDAAALGVSRPGHGPLGELRPNPTLEANGEEPG
ncbi:molybdenum cofactor guanylyltransferase [Arthrobacter sp. Soil763]|uniref:molybdenum cofactor guanylyltransferase n=1 Tax=Arthrobacter sp. Soil763 TaxID=1736402 RepID=UPI000A7ABEAC|nr:NTP transferase domain-containing protein [Arthrobacter sp. Soil763]